jgi:predicted nucleic-acid-binding protein
MIALDTNVLVRYIVQDDPKQAKLANQLIHSLTAAEPGYIGLISVIELVWVMQSCYEASKEEVVAVLDKLLRTQELIIENAETVHKALSAFSKSKADFSDCLIERSANAAGCNATMTFDRNAVKFAGMVLVE